MDIEPPTWPRRLSKSFLEDPVTQPGIPKEQNITTIQTPYSQLIRQMKRTSLDVNTGSKDDGGFVSARDNTTNILGGLTRPLSSTQNTPATPQSPLPPTFKIVPKKKPDKFREVIFDASTAANCWEETSDVTSQVYPETGGELELDSTSSKVIIG